MEALIESLIILAVGMAVGIILRVIVGRALLTWARKTPMEDDDVVVGHIRKRLFWLAISVSLWYIFRVVRFGDVPWMVKSEMLGVIITTLTLVIVVGTILDSLYKLLTLRHPQLVQSTSLIRVMIYAGVGLIGLAFVLNTFGVSVAPALTALGVGGLAVALALQDTLSNLFSGLYIVLAKRIRVGDYVKIESGHEGTVNDITWRHTTILQLNNNLIIVPNVKMAQSIVVNYTVVNPHTSVGIGVSVAHGTDIDLLDAVVLDTARMARTEIEGMKPDADPVLRFNPGFSPSSMDFTLYVEITSFESQFAVTDALRRRLVRRLAEEGIHLANPVLRLLRDDS